MTDDTEATLIGLKAYTPRELRECMELGANIEAYIGELRDIFTLRRKLDRDLLFHRLRAGVAKMPDCGVQTLIDDHETVEFNFIGEFIRAAENASKRDDNKGAREALFQADRYIRYLLGGGEAHG